MSESSVFAELEQELAKWDHLQQNAVQSYEANVKALNHTVERYEHEGTYADESEMSRVLEPPDSDLGSASTNVIVRTEPIVPSPPLDLVVEQPPPPPSSITPPSTWSWGAKLGLALAVAVVVGVVIFIIVYFTVIHKSSDTTYGTLVAYDPTNQTSGPFHPGDTLSLTYTPANDNKIVPGAWKMSTDHGQTFAYTIAPTTAGANVTSYTLPDQVYSSEVVFRVYDVLYPDRFVTSALYAIQPIFALATGPGTQPHQILYPTLNLTTTLTYDPNVLTLTTANLQIQTSASSSFLNPGYQEIVSWDAATRTLVWKLAPDTVEGLLYLRVLTTGVPSYSLAATASEPVTVSKLNCTGISATFDICHVTMLNADGTSGYFVAGATVALVFVFQGTFGGATVWTYNLGDGVTHVPVTPTAGPVVTGDKVTYTWTLPSPLSSSTFTLTATSGSSAVQSANFVIV